MDQKELVTEDTENIVPLQPSKTISGNGGGGDGGLIAYRLGEVEQCVSALESKVDDIRDTCTKISTKVKEFLSKAYVLRHILGLVVLAILTLVGHLLTRNIGAP